MLANITKEVTVSVSQAPLHPVGGGQKESEDEEDRVIMIFLRPVFDSRVTHLHLSITA